MPEPRSRRGSTITIRSRRLTVSRPSPTTPASALPRRSPAASRLRSGHRDRGNRAIRIEVIRAVEIDGIDVAARHELLQIDHFRAFDVERLQFLGSECDELAALIQSDFLVRGLSLRLYRSRITRPERGPIRWKYPSKLMVVSEALPRASPNSTLNRTDPLFAPVGFGFTN
jgi:hypothetical protein